jgi:hypothetical protein
MKNTILVVTDLAGFKAFRIDNGQLTRTPRLELVETFENPGAHGRIVDKVTDLSGRFPRGTGASSQTGAMSDGERHNIELEFRKRFVRKMAERLNTLLRSQEVEQCFLAASREINNSLLGELDPAVRNKIVRNISADLTKTDKSELLRHFEPARGRGGENRAFAD